MRPFPPMTKTARLAVLACLLGLPLTAPLPAAAAQATSTVSVTIRGPVSSISLATGIRFSTIGLPGAASAPSSQASLPPTQQTGTSAGTGNLAVSTSGLAAGAGNVPGAFAVSGDRQQVFSISLPRTVILDVDGTLLELREFRHSAGSTPSTGPDGTAWIAFTADVNRDQLEIFQNMATAAVDTDTIYLEIPADAIAAQGMAVAGEDEDAAAQPQRIAARRPLPFGTPDQSEKLIFVLISYN